MTNKPYRTNKNSPVIDKTTTFTKGWYRTVTEKISQLKQDLSGLRERVKSVQNNTYSEYQEMTGIPASYKRDYVFAPDPQIVSVPAYLQSNNSFYTVAAGNVNSNYVVRSGQSYMIDLQIPGDGVFVAKYLSVSIYQRLFDPVNGPQRISMFNKLINQRSSNRLVQEALKWCISFRDDAQFPESGTVEVQRTLEYFWNIIDQSSGRKFSDALLSCNFLLPIGFPNPMSDVFRPGPIKDSDIFDLGKPWIFERDSQVQFEFRPITDVFQLDPGSGLLPHTFNDREVIDTVRNESVTVRVELHGAKFLTKQDALKHGARFFAQRENQELAAPGSGGNIIDENDDYGI